MLIPSELFASIAQMTIVFPPFVNTLGKVLAIVGAVGIVLMSGRSNKNFALRLALGAYDLYNVSGWLSDVLSYSRLLALGAGDRGDRFCYQPDGKYGRKEHIGSDPVHCRIYFRSHLQSGDQFTGSLCAHEPSSVRRILRKFYEGGGREFNPFKANTKYADVKEETKL